MERSALSPASLRALAMGLPILLLAGLGIAVTLQAGCMGATDDGLAEDQSDLSCGYGGSSGYGGYGGYGSYGRRCRPRYGYGYGYGGSTSGSP